jgi:hypothetical protein
MRLVYSLLAILSFITFTGCVSGPAPAPVIVQNQKPSWIHGGVENGAVGMCDVHMKGEAAQEQVAFDRALLILAKQESAKVSSSTATMQKESGGHYSSTDIMHGNVDASATVKAHIKDSWRDPRTNRYYVLIIKD